MFKYNIIVINLNSLNKIKFNAKHVNNFQVDSSLEVEFGIPAFMRKSVSLRKQKIYVNKYKRSNFVTKMFREDGEMTFEMLSKAVTDDSVILT